MHNTAAKYLHIANEFIKENVNRHVNIQHSPMTILTTHKENVNSHVNIQHSPITNLTTQKENVNVQHSPMTS